MPQLPKTGVYCDLYLNTGSFGSPTWLAISSARDVKLQDEYTKADASIRGDGGYAATLGGLRHIGLQFQVLWYPTATDFSTLHTNYGSLPPTNTEFLALDGPVTPSSGAQGPRFTGIITKFERNEPLDGTVVADLEVERTISANATTWYTA